MEEPNIYRLRGIKHFCADLHADRDGVDVLDRPFATALEMSEHLITNINNYVGRNDILYMLGDIAFNWKETSYWRQRINCRQIFVARGNHDIKIAQLKKIFGEHYVDKILETSIKDLHLELCHYPFLYWNHSHKNAGCLHGHLHDQRTETYMSLFPDIRLLDVSFDSANRILGEYRPFNEHEIYDILTTRKGHDPIEFYESRRKQTNS